MWAEQRPLGPWTPLSETAQASMAPTSGEIQGHCTNSLSLSVPTCGNPGSWFVDKEAILPSLPGHGPRLFLFS